MEEDTKLNILALCGPKYCGKDTAAKGLLALNQGYKKLLFRRAPMAEGVKNIVNETFGIPYETMEDPVLKEQEYPDYPHVAPRWPMMDIANWFREKYSGDVWARRWERVAHQSTYYMHIITDCRFPEELEMLRRHNSMLVYIHRKEAEQSLREAQEREDAMALNPSESHYTMLRREADVVLHNEGTIHSLHNELMSLVKCQWGFWGHWDAEHDEDILYKLRTGAF